MRKDGRLTDEIVQIGLIGLRSSKSDPTMARAWLSYFSGLRSHVLNVSDGCCLF